MKMTLTAVALAALVAFSGCDKGTSGGPGATKDKKGGTVKQEENSFSMSTPTLSTKLKQGETKEVTVGIKRGKNFDQDVALKFDNVPAGVTIEPKEATIKKGDENAKVSVKAADDAAIGDFTVNVVGHPAKGDDAKSELKITVDKK